MIQHNPYTSHYDNQEYSVGVFSHTFCNYDTLLVRSYEDNLLYNILAHDFYDHSYNFQKESRILHRHSNRKSIV